MGNTAGRTDAKERPGDTKAGYYNIWFRHDTESDIEALSRDSDVNMKRFTLEELVRSTEGLSLTHMCIRGEIPPVLHQIAAKLTHLRIRDITSVKDMQHVKRAGRLEKLVVSKNNIMTLPNWMLELSCLRELDVSGCGLTSLPDSMRSLVHLHQLDLFHNNLDKLPSWISELSSLRELNLRWCGIKSISNSMQQLDKLEKLNISGNRIHILPSWLSDLFNFSELAVSFCGLTSLPDSVRRMGRLEILEMSRNDFDKLPSWISELSNLRELCLAYCAITSIPNW